MLGIFWFPNDQVLNEVLQGLSNDQLPTFTLELLAQAQTGTFGSFCCATKNCELVNSHEANVKCNMPISV